MNNNIEMTINIENLIKNLNHDGIVKAENLIDQNDFEKIIDKKRDIQRISLRTRYKFTEKINQQAN